MINLIIDAANDKIFFKIMADDKSYTSEFINNRENFDKLAILVLKFLENYQIDIKNLKNIFVNTGPGKFSGIRASIAIAKALSFTNEINLYDHLIKKYEASSDKENDPIRKRKLLLNKKELNKLLGSVKRDGFSIEIGRAHV